MIILYDRGFGGYHIAQPRMFLCWRLSCRSHVQLWEDYQSAVTRRSPEEVDKEVEERVGWISESFYAGTGRGRSLEYNTTWFLAKWGKHRTDEYKKWWFIRISLVLKLDSHVPAVTLNENRSLVIRHRHCQQDVNVRWSFWQAEECGEYVKTLWKLGLLWKKIRGNLTAEIQLLTPMAGLWDIRASHGEDS